MSIVNEWPMVKLGDLGRFISGGTPNRKRPEFYEGSIPWISSADLSDTGKISTRRSITEEAIASSATKLVPAHTILIATRIGVGKVAITSEEMCFSQDIVALVDIDEAIVSSSFLKHMILIARPYLQGIARGVTIKGISTSDLQRLELPLPPLPEQQRIADVLNQTTSILEFARQEVRKIDESRSALFESLFPASNYPASTIGNFLSETQYGSSKKSAEAGKYPMLRMGNLSSTGSISYSDLKYLNLEEKEVNKYTLRNHDILFNRTNSKELVGKTAVYYGEDDQIAYAGYLIRCRTNDLATPEFISGFLNSRIGKAQLFQRAKAIVGMANINAKELRTLRIPAVPVEEQEKYTSASRQLENLRLAVEKKVEKLEELQQSLSTRAFAGQL